MPIFGSVANNAKGRNPYNFATGGIVNIYTGNGTNGVLGRIYQSHTFTTIGANNFAVVKTTGLPFEILMVGGGGSGGGGNGSGGGGAGGYWENTNLILSAGSYTANVGGAAQSTSFSGYTNFNGGYSVVPAGGAGSNFEGGGGASGGGGGHYGGPGRGTAGGGISGFGNPGGSAGYSQSLANGGGGGGAGGAGEPQINEFGGGTGGAGRVNYFRDGTAITYSIGGTSSGRDRPNPGTPAGFGNGGGGGNGNEFTPTGPSGTQGIVIIRYIIG